MPKAKQQTVGIVEDTRRRLTERIDQREQLETPPVEWYEAQYHQQARDIIHLLIELEEISDSAENLALSLHDALHNGNQTTENAEELGESLYLLEEALGIDRA